MKRNTENRFRIRFGMMKLIKAAAIGAAALALASCGNLFSSIDDSDSSGNALASGEKAAVTFNFSTLSRTALPDVTLSNYKYTITAAGADSKETTLVEKQNLADGKLSASIDAGTYTFRASAYLNDTIVLTGTSSETAVSSSNTSVGIMLKAATGGTGSVSVTLKIADSLGASKVTAGLYDEITSTDSGAEQSLDTTANSGYTTVTYSNDSVATGVSKYVVFFIYESSSNLIMPYAESVYVVNGLASSSEYTISGETFVATVTLQKNGSSWADSGAEVTLVSTNDSSDTITLTAASGEATYTGNAASGSTYTVYVNGKKTEKTVSSDSATATVNIVELSLFPENGATEAYADTYLEIAFDSAPAINRASEGTVRIYKSDGTLVDTIKPAAETLTCYGYGGNSGLGSINAQYQLIQVVDTNKVRIIPHHNTSTGLTLLSNNSSYYVLVDNGLISGTAGGEDFEGITDSSTWTFTTGSAPSVSNNTLTVGTGKEFITVQGALSYLMANSKTGSWEIDIEPGTYYERIFYSGKANIVMSGKGSASYGSDVVIQWANQDGGEGTALWNSGVRGRGVFFYHGGDLVLENLSIVNTATRKTNSYGEYDATSGSDLANNNNQAETLMFDSTGNAAAYNCSFTSKQDTVYLSPSGGKGWFYGCRISGDVDFIWGLSDVALFEKCDIVSLYDSDKSSNHVSYVVASHLAASSAPYGKGFVVYNSTITSQSGETTYLARSPWGSSGNVAQVAIVNTAVTGGLGSDSTYWYGEHVGGTDETVLGWKSYGITVDSSALTDSTYGMTEAMCSAEFAGRRNILNRVYNGSEFEKDTTTNWDVDTLISERNWTVDEDASKETLSGESETTSVVWDTSKVNLSQTRNKTFYMLTDLTTTETVPAGDALYNYLYCDGSANDYIQGSLELYGTAAIYVPVKSTSKVTVAFTKGAGTLAIAGTEYTATGTAAVDCSSATLATLNGISYVELRVKGSAASTSDKYWITNVAVATTSGSSTSGGGDDTNYISLSDTPTGYAGVDYSSKYGSTSYTTVSPTSAADLKTYLKSSAAYIIKLSGDYDLSEGYLPSTAGGSSDLLDALVLKVSTTDDTSNAYTDYSTYSAWKEGYASSCISTTNDKKSDTSKLVWALNSAYQDIVKVNVNSNKIIIGDGSAVIKGGLLNISGKSNIIIRNVTIQDAYDPFPHHESGDGFNAELDCICIQGSSSYVWIDHCTLQDTLGYSYVTISDGSTKEKWQTFDGLCDIKSSTSNITISYCKITNHDKTMLIGSSDTDGSSDTRTITLHHNYFYNCGQRLPMVRNSTIHIYNNYYHADSNKTYSQQYAIGPRAGSIVYSEANYFSSGIKYSFKIGSSDTAGKYYESGSTDNSSGVSNISSSGATLFSSAVQAYSYEVDTSSELPALIPANAGAGVWSVKN